MTNQNEQQCQELGDYQAYLIRLWQDGEQATWRASAQSVHSGEIMRFVNLVRLFAFLEAQTVVTLPLDDSTTSGDVRDVGP